jgi:hypothetical protein
MKKTVLFSLSFAFLLLFSSQSFAQAVLKGKVIDSQNLSLPGASVVLKGTANGTVTNQKGEFSFINLASGSYEVEVSYLGYAPATQSVGQSTSETSGAIIHLLSIRETTPKRIPPSNSPVAPTSLSTDYKEAKVQLEQLKGDKLNLKEK